MYGRKQLRPHKNRYRERWSPLARKTLSHLCLTGMRGKIIRQKNQALPIMTGMKPAELTASAQPIIRER